MQPRHQRITEAASKLFFKLAGFEQIMLKISKDTKELNETIDNTVERVRPSSNTKYTVIFGFFGSEPLSPPRLFGEAGEKHRGHTFTKRIDWSLGPLKKSTVQRGRRNRSVLEPRQQTATVVCRACDQNWW